MTKDVLPYTIKQPRPDIKHPLGSRCGMNSPVGLVCVRERGHPQGTPHEAHVIPKGTNRVVKKIYWPQEDGE